MHRILWLGLALGFLWTPIHAQETTDQKIQDLQKQIDQLKSQVQSRPAENAATTTADYANGFTIRSQDGNFVLHIGADIQADNHAYLGSGSGADADSIELRRVRPTLYGTVYKYVDFFIRPDFGLGTTAMYDAYIQLNYFSWFQVRAGKFKPPVALERLQNDDDTTFAERGLPTLLAPQRDIGYQVGADLFHRRVSYQLGVFNGVPDNSIGSDLAASGHRDYAARVFLTPFEPEGNAWTRGLGFGFGASAGGTDGQALPLYRTFGQQPFLTFAAGVTAAGHRTRLAPQGYYYVGPFGLLVDYGRNQEGFQKGAVRDRVTIRAYQVQASYILTGERKSFASPTPKRNFDPLHGGGWGAWELAARVGDWEAPDSIYSSGLVNAANSPRRLHEWVGGVNWYLNRLLRITGDYGHTSFGGGAPRPAEQVFTLRFQINFGVI